MCLFTATPARSADAQTPQNTHTIHSCIQNTVAQFLKLPLIIKTTVRALLQRAIHYATRQPPPLVDFQPHTGSTGHNTTSSVGDGH